MYNVVSILVNKIRQPMYFDIFKGKEVLAKGSHEAVVFSAVPQGTGGISQPELMKLTGANGKIGLSKAIQNGWIKSVKEGGVNKVVRLVDTIEDKVKIH